MTQAAPLRAAVVGSTGYIGMQCTALLAAHPDVELSRVLGHSSAGRRHCDVVPGSTVELTIEDGLDPGSVDVVLAALPHTVAAARAAEWLSAGAAVIDCSADFRLHDAQAYARWYGVDHPAADLLDEAVYAMVELQRERLAAANLISVPGCYPTAALLACVPALRAGLIEPDIIVDAKSGVSGAGRAPKLGTSFAEVNESVHAYSVEGHRHKSEMLEQLRDAAGADVQCTFVPHLVPMTRGILATAYLRPSAGVTAAHVRDLYETFAATSPFLDLVAAPPTTKSVTGTNRAAIHVGWQDGVAVVTVAIDNLGKGGAGQAVHALNVRFGFDETAGLESRVLWP
ncbi:MAG: N-acetyl-gamma-glutamyl-phosphate reductase [Chloroflexota bacterium]|nr:N-acetyl-gamma-glutamyl-phosphate reductase [Chloroflexota bacterium]